MTDQGKSPEKDKESPETKIEFNPENPLNGIFAHLNQKHNGNLQTRGIVYVTASTTLGNHPWQVIETDWTSHWVSEDLPDQWIKIDLKNARMALTHYSLKTYNYVTGGNHLRSWVLEGSINDQDWVELDRRQSTNDLNEKNKIQTYQVKTPGLFRFFRLTQTGKSHCDSNMMALTSIEFFGTHRLVEQ